MARGPKSKYPEEIRDLALELQVTRGWGPAKIAEYLFHHKGVASPDDPNRPVDRVTIWRWQRKTAKTIREEKVYAEDVESVRANLTLDDLKKFLYALVAEESDLTLKDGLEWFDRAMALQREKSTTNGVYPERRKRVVHEGAADVGGVGRRELEPRHEFDMAQFEAWLAETKGEQPVDEFPGCVQLDADRPERRHVR